MSDDSQILYTQTISHDEILTVILSLEHYTMPISVWAPV